MHQTHALRRTSPKGPGQQFVGICTLCGTPNLTFEDQQKPCPNQRRLTTGEALSELIRDH